MNARTPVLLAALVGLFSLAQADLLDPFNGSSLNAANWTASTPFGDSSVAVTGGNLELTNRGRVLTNAGFSGTVDTLLAFQFTGSLYDSFHVVLRTDGASNNAPGEFDNGIFATFRMRSDTGDTSNNVFMFSQQNPNGVHLGLGTFAMSLNETYLIRLLDDGTNVSLFINDLVNPFMTVATTESYGNQIGLDNREGAGAGSGISAGSQVKVDFVAVHVPEAGVTALYLGLGLAGMLAIGRRKPIGA